jgi:glutaredoxin 3
VTITAPQGAGQPTTHHAPVTLYATETCPYCVRAKALLKARGVTVIDEVRVDRDPAARLTMIERTGRRTVPQIFIRGAHIGGCDDLIELDQRGGLLPLLQPHAAPG